MTQKLELRTVDLKPTKNGHVDKVIVIYNHLEKRQDRKLVRERVYCQSTTIQEICILSNKQNHMLNTDEKFKNKLKKI